MPKAKSNPTTWLIVGIVVVAAAALAYVYAARPATQSTATTPSNQQAPPAPKPTAKPTPPASAQPGAYVGYSAQAFEQAATRRILFFHAPWCPQCRALEQSITSQGVPSGMTILKVDYDTATDLRQKYGVTLQTTVVEVDPNGNLIKKHVAYNEPSLPAVLEALSK